MQPVDQCYFLFCGWMDQGNQEQSHPYLEEKLPTPLLQKAETTLIQPFTVMLPLVLI
jgi:hypothetical protein